MVKWLARAAILTGFVGGCSEFAVAQLPSARLDAIRPAGGQLGTTLDVTLHGSDLDEAQQLIFSAAGVSATKENDGFRVTIAQDAAPGRCECRVWGKFGVSNPRSFMVGVRPEISEIEPNGDSRTAQQATLGAVINGFIEDAQDVDCYAIDLQKDQRVIIDCWAERIDSRIDATLVLTGPDGQERKLSRNHDGRDPLVDYRAQQTGRHWIKIYDFLYRGGNDYFYRLHVGLGPRIDFVFPPVGRGGTTQSVTLFGRHLPAGIPADGVELDGVSLEQMAVDVTFPARGGQASAQIGNRLARLDQAGIEAVDITVKSPAGISNSVPVGIATAPLVLEHEPNDVPEAAQPVSLPCEYVGQFSHLGDRDWITFDAVQGQTYWIEVFARRHGLRSDPYVVLQQVQYSAQGTLSVKDLQESDDKNRTGWQRKWCGTGEDPSFRFQVPSSGRYRLMIRDLYAASRGGPDLTYRVAIRSRRPDFRLLAVSMRERARQNANYEPGAPFIRAGGTAILVVLADRQDGFRGPIELSVAGLPPGLQCRRTILGPGVDSGLLVIESDESAKSWCGPIQVVAKAKINGQEVERRADVSALQHVLPNNANLLTSRLTNDLLLAVSHSEESAYQLHVGGENVFDVAVEGKTKIPVRLERGTGAGHPVKINAHALPPKVTLKEITLAGDKIEGELELEVAKDAPLGEFTLALKGESEQDYRRNQDVVDQARQTLAESRRELQRLEAAVEAHRKSKAEAEDKKRTVAKLVESSLAKLGEARMVEAATVSQMDSLEALAQVAANAVRQQPENVALVSAIQFVEAERKKTDSKLQRTRSEIVSLTNAITVGEGNMEAARQSLALAETSLKKALVDFQTAEERVQAAAAKAKELNEQNKPEKRQVTFTSNAIVLHIKPQS